MNFDELILWRHPSGASRFFKAPFTSADTAFVRLRWCIGHDRAAALVGRWVLALESPETCRGPWMRLQALAKPTGYFRGRPLSDPAVALKFQRWLKPRYRWRWRR